MSARCVLLIGMLSIASPAMAESLVNTTNNFCLDTDGAAVNGALVRMWQCVSHPHQTWKRSVIID